MVIANEEVAIVESATQVLNEIMAAPAQGIPVALLHDAKGIIICPGLLKGGFMIGVRHGRGVLVVHDDNGNWRAPSFISITGGSIGWQIGIQATDMILVFKTKKSIQGLINGKFTIGGDVSAAAGPVGAMPRPRPICNSRRRFIPIRAAGDCLPGRRWMARRCRWITQPRRRTTAARASCNRMHRRDRRRNCPLRRRSC